MIRLFNNKYFLLLFFSFQIGTASSQLFVSGQDPSSIKWQQINTENFQLIFPEGFEKQAQYFANALKQAYQLVPQTLKKQPRKISVLLHNRSAISNGTTAWAPARIDAYTTPPQDSYAEHWLNQLAVHELRHVVQIEKMNDGLTKVLGIFFGQQAAAAIAGVYLPWWFIEGDAVVTETALSNSGRGRLSSFEMPLKAQLLEKGKYSYEKATHGSFKNFTPNSYELGYQMVAYGRSKYGSELWENVLENVARKPLSLTSFSSGIKKSTGLSKREYYTASINFLTEKWRGIQAEIKTTNYHPITKVPSHYSSFLNPVSLSDGSIIAFKTSMDDVSRISRINPSGNEDVLLIPGSSYRGSLSLGGNILCWAEIEADPRWAQRSYSIIKLFNIKTKVLADLSHKSRYFSPQINRRGTKVAAVEVGVNNEYRLVILNAFNGDEIFRYESQDGTFLMNPTWSENDNEIVMTIFNNDGKNIRIINIKNGETQDILDHSFSEISKPRLISNRVFFIADYSGIDNIYVFDRISKEIKQVSSVKYGVGSFCYNSRKKELIFSNYTSNGFELASQIINPQKEILLSKIQINHFSFAEKLASQEDGIVKVDPEKIENFEVKKYAKSSGLLNFHSWAPLSIDMNTYETKPGIMFMSQNLLSTAITTLGYVWDLDEKVGKYFANFEYRGWYPVIDLNLEYGKRRDVYRYIDSLDQQHEVRYTFHEFETSIGISQPLNFSKNKFISGITPFVRLNHTYQNTDKEFHFEFLESSYQSLEYGISAYHYLRSSLRDIYPKWGIISRIRYTHTPFTSLKKSHLFAFEAIAYTPGFMRHHGFKIYGAAQLRTVGNYNPSNVISFVRGLSRPGLHDLYRLSINYKFPLFYPDWDLGSVMYLKRLTMALFYDYAYGTTPDFSKHYYSVGIELQAQMHIFSFMAPVNVGFRAVYLPDYSDYVISAFLSIDFSVLK